MEKSLLINFLIDKVLTKIYYLISFYFKYFSKISFKLLQISFMIVLIDIRIYLFQEEKKISKK